MVKYLGIRVVGAVLLAFYTATDTALNILQITELGPRWLPLVTLISFTIIIFWIVYDIKRANERLLNNRPTITVQPVKEGNTYFLKVHNEGAEGLCKAQMQLVAEDPSVWGLSQYDGFWEKANGHEAKILTNHDDCIKIAERISSPPDFNSVHLRIVYYNPKMAVANPPTGGEAHCDSSSYWIGATITSQDGSVRPLTKHEYRLCVTISSSPALRNGIYQEHYRLNVDGLEVDAS